MKVLAFIFNYNIFETVVRFFQELRIEKVPNCD